MLGPIPGNIPSHHLRVGTTDTKPLKRTTEGRIAAKSCAGESPVLETSADTLIGLTLLHTVHLHKVNCAVFLCVFLLKL